MLVKRVNSGRRTATQESEGLSMRRTIWIAAIVVGATVALVAWMRTWAWQSEESDRGPLAGEGTSNGVVSASPLRLPPPLMGVTYSQDAPVYNLPLVFEIEAPAVPDRIKGPSPPIPSRKRKP
jgi:hypothetical protein